MNAVLQVDIRELCPSFGTRHRGHEAYHKLEALALGRRIVLNLDSAEIVSQSFIDGFTYRLRDGRLSFDEITFKTSNDRTLRMLRKTEKLRNVKLLVSSDKGP